MNVKHIMLSGQLATEECILYDSIYPKYPEVPTAETADCRLPRVGGGKVLMGPDAHVIFSHTDAG